MPTSGYTETFVPSAAFLALAEQAIELIRAIRFAPETDHAR